MVAELVDEDVLRKAAVHRRGCLIVEDAAASVGPLVDENLDELVGRRCGRVAQGAIVEGQDVPLRIEDVVFGGDRGAPEHARVGPVHAACW